VTAESRRGSLTVRCQVVTTIRPDVVFVPYHWAGVKSINRVTISSQDPISKIPEYKVCAVRLRKAEPPEYAARLEPQQ
jgi:assimilatory nitrate reductase catalytic subunit